MKSPRWSVFAGALLLLAGPSFCRACAQEPPPPAAPANVASPAANPKKQKYSHANDFLIFGTVFNPRGYAFPEVQLRIRRSGEKKFHWNTYTNSRGDFAVRVPQGTDYEMVVHAKGFADQTHSMDAKSGANETRLVFRMEPVGAAKDGKR